MWECEIELHKKHANLLLVSSLCHKLGSLVLYLNVLQGVEEEHDMALI